MRFASPLIPGRLIKRYKRFLADVALPSGETLTVHCANPGSMAGLTTPGNRVYVSCSNNPKRKLTHSLELVEADGALVGINTTLPNRIAAEAIEKGVVPPLANFARLRREVRYGNNSRIDLLLESADNAAPKVYVEVKNVHFKRRSELAEFPDSVTARGAKHLREMTAMVSAGHRAAMLYVIQRADCERLALARDMDPAYVDAFEVARDGGVEAYAVACSVTLDAIEATRLVPIIDHEER